MVRVPVTTQRSREVQPLGNDRLRYAERRNYVGRAVEGFGQAIGQAAQDWDAIEATYDETDALRIANEFSAYERERLRTGENAYLTTQGFNAGEGREAAVTDLHKGAENLLSGARSERARNMAQRALTARLDASETRIAEHAVSQMRVAQTEQSQARIAGAITDAIDLRNEPEQFEVNLALAEMELGTMAGRLGWGEAQLAEEREKLISNALSRTVLAIDAEDGEPTRALEFLEANKDRITPGEEAELMRSLTPRVDAAWARDIVESGGLETYLPGTAAPTAEPEPTEDAQPIAISIPFGGNATTVAGGRYGAPRSYGGHTGVDYAGLPAGTAVPVSAPGTVIKSEFRKGYGHRVEVDHGTDAQGRRIITTYSHLADRRVEVGDQVDAESIVGGVGASGGNYGTHLHWEVLVDGQKVDPATISGVRVQNGAPGAGGVPADPRLNSQTMRQAVDAYIAANPGISERRREALYAAADQSVSQARQDRAQAEQDADRRVLDWLTQNKPGADDLTDIGQIPASVLAGVSPSTMASLQDRIQATHSRIQSRNEAAAAAQAEAIEAAAIFELYTLTDDQLATVDLRQYAGRIGFDKLGPWVDRQQRAAQAGTTGSNKPVSSDRIASKIDAIGRAYGASRAPDAEPEEREAWIALRGYVERRVAGRPNGEVSDEELRGIIAAGMTEVEVKGSGWIWNDTKPAAMLQPGEVGIAQVPGNIKREIEANLTPRLGRPPTGKEVWEAYQSGLARGIYE